MVALARAVPSASLSWRIWALEAKATQATLRLRVAAENARFSLQDDGQGFHSPVLEDLFEDPAVGGVVVNDEDRSRVFGKADAIFCRNVLIYFDARARRNAIEVLYERLNPGGVLLLGHSESLLNVSTAFELLHLRDDLVYRKPLSAREAGPASEP